VKAFPNRANRQAVYAVVDNGFDCSGRGGGGYAYGRPNMPNSFPHEVGHAVGLNHAGPPPGHGPICPPGWRQLRGVQPGFVVRHRLALAARHAGRVWL
ncbi:MAG: hypothetical protein GXP42_17170, partial [Chloroflexi bacterium]|nr:hypothetical protein [Chloroflexota bacterium]